jgi:F0F1-type ATP synthase delta subunit
MAQAIMLPPTDMLESYHQNALLTRPEGKRLTQLEREMANILARTDISERQKMELFSLALQNFRRVRGEIVNKGLMLTSTNAPQPEITSTDEIFKEIQETIQKAIGSNTAQSNIQSTPTSQQLPKVTKTTPKLSASAKDIQKQLLSVPKVTYDQSKATLTLAGKQYSKEMFHKTLRTMASNDDFTSTDPAIKDLSERIYKSLLKGPHDFGNLAKFSYFKDLAQHATVTPRKAKVQKIAGTPQLQRTIQRKQQKSSGRRSNSSFHTPSSAGRNSQFHTPQSGGGFVNFSNWDTYGF